jgi:predicted dehydrogenase
MKIRQLVDSGALGKLYYFDSTRVNLGLFQHDVNVIWDLAPHDLSVMDHIILEKPEAVVATGGRHLNGLADVAFITVYFPGTVIAHVNVNWLSPVKVRRTLLGGSRRMVVFDDLEASEKIKVYDRGISLNPSPENVYQMLIGYRAGDMWAPQIAVSEALTVEAAHFVACIRDGAQPITGGEAGLHVVRLLEAATESMAKQGQLVTLRSAAHS